MPSCVSCGFKKDKAYLCERCNQAVCHKCVTQGLCKDCFTLEECGRYRSDYEYKDKKENESYA